MFRSYFEPSADVTGYEFACIFTCSRVAFSVIAFVQQQVVTHATADKAFLYSREVVNRTVYVKQAAVVGVKVGADARTDT